MSLELMAVGSKQLWRSYVPLLDPTSTDCRRLLMICGRILSFAFEQEGHVYAHEILSIGMYNIYLLNVKKKVTEISFEEL